jgi:hypothetical protein
VWGAAPGDVWATGSTGVLLHFDGTSWTQVPSGASKFLWGVSGRRSDDVWAVGEAGMILHYR